MFEYNGETKRLVKIIEEGAKTAASNKNIIEIELLKWKNSKKRKRMIEGNNYYVGKHDILNKTRTSIDVHGNAVTVNGVPNSIIVDNQYKKMVDQKVNYLFGKPITFECDNDNLHDCLLDIFNMKFNRIFRLTAKNSYNCGIAWLFIYINDFGKLDFKLISSEEILPFWKDEEHTVLDFAVRDYEVEVYEGRTKTIVEYIEVYGPDGIDYYTFEGGRLIEDVTKEHSPYLVHTDSKGNQTPLNWLKIPLIPFKYNVEELPLLIHVKSIQDAINQIMSNFEDNMLQDQYNSIYVLVNYDGENLAQFRHNVNTYGAVKVRSINGVQGDVKTLGIEVNSSNYTVILEELKKAMIENAMGYDAKDDRLGGNANQMNIKSMYSDIDLDANTIETEFQASFEEILWFVKNYLKMTNIGDYTDENVKVVFNRDMLMNEQEIMSMLLNAGLQLSQETLLNQVPFITDAKSELERVKEEKKENIEEYSFGNMKTSQNEPEDGSEDDLDDET